MEVISHSQDLCCPNFICSIDNATTDLVFSPTVSFILKSLEGTYSLSLRNHVIITLLCPAEMVRSEVV